MQLRHPDAALAHPDDELGVVPSGVVHPQHVAEEQVVAIAGVSREWARPGAQTSTFRRTPTSECTP